MMAVSRTTYFSRSMQITMLANKYGNARWTHQMKSVWKLYTAKTNVFQSEYGITYCSDNFYSEYEFTVNIGRVINILLGINNSFKL